MIWTIQLTGSTNLIYNPQKKHKSSGKCEAEEHNGQHMQNKNWNSNENRKTTDTETRITFSQVHKLQRRIKSWAKRICSQLNEAWATSYLKEEKVASEWRWIHI